MSQSLGLFKTEQVQEDGSIIYIMHNKADLNSSNIQWKMTANGMAVSSDYGKTWNAGIDKDGNAIFNIMSAIGINFDWAHGGTLTLGGENNVNGKQYVKDANGKTLVTLDNKGIALDSSVKIAWDNVADTTAKVTQITKDTVTTSYVNALSVKAGSVDAEDITGTTITGKDIVGNSSISLTGGSVSDTKFKIESTNNVGTKYRIESNGGVFRMYKNDEAIISLYGPFGSVGANILRAADYVQSPRLKEEGRGYAMCGDTTGHTYHCDWKNDTTLSFQVDDTWVWSSSDKRLKKNIKAINQDYIDAVGSVNLFQYNLNRQGYSDKPLYFGAMAQDIIENLKDKGHVDENLNMIFQNKATSDDDTLYYGMNYEQFLILRLAGDEQKIDKMQKHLDELEDKFSRLCQKLAIDESEV